jgi:hypothetical protein
MATDLTIELANRPGTLAEATDALGRAGINIEGACGYARNDVGEYHVLVSDVERARRALVDAGFQVTAERRVATVQVEDRPGAAAALLCRVADAGANVDLLYVAVDGRLVVSGDRIELIEAALAGSGGR